MDGTFVITDYHSFLSDFRKSGESLKISLNKKSEYKTVQKRHWHLRWFSFWPYLIKKKINYHLRQIRNTWFIFFWINNLTLICQKYTNKVLDFQIFQIHKNKMSRITHDVHKIFVFSLDRETKISDLQWKRFFMFLVTELSLQRSSSTQTLC